MRNESVTGRREVDVDGGQTWTVVGGNIRLLGGNRQCCFARYEVTEKRFSPY